MFPCVCVQSSQSFKRQARSFVMMIANMVGHQVKVLTLERQRHGRRLKVESIAVKLVDPHHELV